MTLPQGLDRIQKCCPARDIDGIVLVRQSLERLDVHQNAEVTAAGVYDHRAAFE